MRAPAAILIYLIPFIWAGCCHAVDGEIGKTSSVSTSLSLTIEPGVTVSKAAEPQTYVDLTSGRGVCFQTNDPYLQYDLLVREKYGSTLSVSNYKPSPAGGSCDSALPISVTSKLAGGGVVIIQPAV